MTYIEFFDQDPLLNVAACLAKTPARVVFIGSDRKKMEAHVLRYGKLLADRSQEIEFVTKSVNQNDLSALVDALTDIIATDECVVDLTGGSEMAILAMGMLLERNPKAKVHLRRFLPGRSIIQEITTTGEKNTVGKVSLSIPEAIALRGGRIVYAEEKDDATYTWEVTPEFEAQVADLWDYCRRDPSNWNRRVGELKRYEAAGLPVSPTVTPVFWEDANDLEFPRGAFWDFLSGAGLLRVEKTEKGFTLHYASPQVKKALLQEGQVLELVVYLALLKAGVEEELPVDVMTGVSLLWDDDNDPEETENEVDVIALRGTVPVFISCKNGRVEPEELYKLSTVTERFGGELGRAVLIANQLPEEGRFAQSFRTRAEDMNIRILDDLEEYAASELPRLLANLWRN